jgi:putative SOS response-associated peptidase YedK
LFEGLDLEPRYNIAPSQDVLAVRLKPGKTEPEAVNLHWGLIPSWADDPKIGYKLINARVETARDKPSFRSAFKNRHCLVLADGFYEWKKPKEASTGRKSSGAAKQPYHIHLRDGRPFAFAGLWEHWEREGQKIESCTILTTDANDALGPLHDRMPVILQREHLMDWLNTAGAGAKACDYSYLGPFPSELLEVVAVSPLVNSPRNNGPECLKPAVGGP